MRARMAEAGYAPEDVTVVVLGALFIDLYEVEDLTQHDGVFFYTPFYADMGHQLDDYVTSLKQMARLTVPLVIPSRRAALVKLCCSATATATRARVRCVRRPSRSTATATSRSSCSTTRRT